MQSIKKYYMLVCLAISNDKYHKDNNLIHLVSSIFYTTNFNTHFEELTKINEMNRLNTVVLRIIRDRSLYFKATRYNNSLAHIEISFLYFWELYMKSKEYSDFVDEIFQHSYQELNTNTIRGTGYKNILYVFEDLNWLDVQWFFKIKKVIISGGSITKRQYLSTTEFNLSLYLYLLGYTDVDIYESHKLAKLFKTREDKMDISNDVSPNMALISLKGVLKSWYEEKLNIYEDKFKTLEQEISSRKERIQLTQNELSEKNKEILSKNKSIYNSKKVKRIEANIREQKKALLLKEKEVSDLDNLILELKQRKDKLTHLPLTELKKEYIQYIQKIKKSKDLNTVKHLLTQTKKLGSSQSPTIITTRSRE